MSAGNGNVESLREISVRRQFLSEKLLKASYSNDESIVFGAFAAVQVGGDHEYKAASKALTYLVDKIKEMAWYGVSCLHTDDGTYLLRTYKHNPRRPTHPKGLESARIDEEKSDES
ncbi:hypothetical protein AVEN_193054-1 [Araneus ventricosus]|uniref:Uncharacterized protein n=1 Tax=Araneus ventricosus TaxID=182803 RepID=A0A4Y2P3S3_ARAVE|nr:hypothetical protein AVEN_193054-1 [Araneus ventricosus]